MNENQFTVIYTRTLGTSNRVTTVHTKRIEKKDGESCRQMLDREGFGINDANAIQYLFHGHPQHEGEAGYDIVNKTGDLFKS